MNPKAMRRMALLAAWACAALVCAPLRAGEEARPAKPAAAAEDALKPFDNPKRIDLEGQGLALNDVLAKIEAHFGWKLSPTTVDLAKYKVDLAVKGATCYEALDAVRRAAKLGYADAQPADAKVLPISFCELGEKGVCLAVAKGPFLFRVSGTARQSNRMIPFGMAPEKGSASRATTVSIYTEPGMKLSAPKIEKAYSEAPGGVRQEVNAWLHDYGMNHVPGAAKTYTPYFTAVQETGGAVSIGGNLVVQVPQAVERRVIEDLDAQIGKTLDLGGGSLEFKKIYDSERGVTLPFLAKGAAARIVSDDSGGLGFAGAMVMGGAGLGGAGLGDGAASLEDQVPKDQPGLWFFDANRAMVHSHGKSMRSSGQEGADWDVTISMPVRPKGVIVQWIGKQAERSVAFEIAGVPEP